MPEKMVLSYSCKLHFSHNDNMHQPVPAIDLPENATAADLVHVAKRQHLETGKIEVIKTQKIIDTNIPNHVLKTITNSITLYVDDKVKTPDEIYEYLKRRYHSDCWFSPKNKPKTPAVLIGHIVYQRNAAVYGGGKFETWNEQHADVHSLQPDTDILVNSDLKEIWPTDTGVMPEIVQKFFENER